MDTTGSLLERLRQQLADLESTQRRNGGTAGAGFWATPSPDAAQPGPEDEAGRACAASAESASAESTDRSGVPLPLMLDWSTFTAVGGRLAPTFAFAAGITRLPHLQTTSVDEDDLIASATQLGRVQQHHEVALLRVVMEMDARGVASPGGLSRLDWLRTLDSTLTAPAAKAISTCAAAFNEPRWAQLRDAVTGSGGAEAASAGDRVTVGKAA